MKLFVRVNILILISIFFTSGCRSVTYADPSHVQGTKQWGVKEVRETSESMVNSLSNHYFTEIKNGYFEWERFKNNTSEHIDTDLISNEISTGLVKRNVPFVDTRLRENSSKEVSFGQTGMVNGETRVAIGKFKSPSHALKGELNDLVNYESGKKIQYIVVTLRLIKLDSTRVEWMEQSKFLKISTVEGYGL
ncbi:penicillin-binding protein activator LpoB [Leptospira ognonensis]|uniref:Penicillin-binding protein activator LpoB n=1 Tax=Leptospira ognonensis TaxID=2484945 RepID=A0A4V3JRG8_9LEPT|nr:penicillin-binding protein activator LpoB [Leptospira ognonensis]TGL60205.1 penicillin-binding protein activator LpoB [Leptospira ognonensis]